VQQTATLRAKISRRTLALRLALALILTAGAAASAAFLAGRRAARPTPSVTVPPYEIPPLVAFPLLPPDKNLLPDVPASVRTDGILEGWRYAVEDRSRQQLTLGMRDGALTLRIVHSEPRVFQLESPLINLAGTNLRALRLAGRAHRLENFDGSVLYHLVTYSPGPDGRPREDATERFEARAVKRKGDSAVSLSRKIELPRRVTHVRVRIVAEFAGAIELDRPQLTGEDGRASRAPQGKDGK